VQRIVKVFGNDRNRAARLPRDFQIRAGELYIGRSGEDTILSPRPADWSHYLENGPVASPKFMDDVEDLPVREHEG